MAPSCRTVKRTPQADRKISGAAAAARTAGIAVELLLVLRILEEGALQAHVRPKTGPAGVAVRRNGLRSHTLRSLMVFFDMMCVQSIWHHMRRVLQAHMRTCCSGARWAVQAGGISDRMVNNSDDETRIACAQRVCSNSSGQSGETVMAGAAPHACLLQCGSNIHVIPSPYPSISPSYL